MYIFCKYIFTTKSQVSTVGIATGYKLGNEGVGVQVQVGARILTSPCHPDQLWGHPAYYPMGTGESFPGGGSGWGMKLTN
jgi:hypothetical protein